MQQKDNEAVWVYLYILPVVQLLSCVQLFLTSWTAAHQAPLSSISPGVSSNTCPLSWWCYLTVLPLPPLFSFCLQSFPALESFPVSWLCAIRWPKYWSFSFTISPFSEYSGLISFRFDLLAVQGTLKRLFQHHNLKASTLQHSAFLWPNSHTCTWLLEKP